MKAIWARRHRRRRAAILLHDRVAEPHHDSQPLAVAPDRFAPPRLPDTLEIPVRRSIRRWSFPAKQVGGDNRWSVLEPPRTARQAACAETLDSKRMLQVILGHPMAGSAYPDSSKARYGPESGRLVADAGYPLDWTNIPGSVHASHRPLESPRLLMRDWEAQEFAEQLGRWVP